MLVAQLQAGRRRPEPGRAASPCRAAATLSGDAGGDDATACEFRTAHDVDAVADRGRVGELLLVRAGPAAERAADRAAHQGRPADPAEGDRRRCKFAQTAARPAAVLPGRPRRRREQAATSCAWRAALGVLVLPGKARRAGTSSCRRQSIRPVGFADDEALLPVTLRSFQGYRLLQEYFCVSAALPVLRADRARAGASGASTPTRSSS